MGDRKLNLDCVPQGMVRSLAKTHKGLWKKIRDAHFTGGSLNCEICETAKANKTLLDGHEVWKCLPRAIKLVKVVFLCKLCHDAIHLERLRGKRPTADYLKAVEAHYCSQNGVTEYDLKRDYVAMKERKNEIFFLYKGVAPPMEYGPYQEEAEAAQGRKWADDDHAPFEQYPDHECPWDVGHAD